MEHVAGVEEMSTEFWFVTGREETAWENRHRGEDDFNIVLHCTKNYRTRSYMLYTVRPEWR
jgi:hypothetical protein